MPVNPMGLSQRCFLLYESNNWQLAPSTSESSYTNFSPEVCHVTSGFLITAPDSPELMSGVEESREQRQAVV